MGFDSKCDFCLSYHLAGACPLPLHVGYLFLVASNILLSMIVQQRVVILEFSQEKLSARPSTSPTYLINKRDVLFIIGDWNAKVGSQEIPGETENLALEYKM